MADRINRSWEPAGSSEPATSGLVDAAAREVMREYSASRASLAVGTPDGANSPSRKLVAVVLVSLCSALTAINVGRLTRTAQAPDMAQAAGDAIELFVGDLEAFRRSNGHYPPPEQFEDPFEDGAWRYELVSPQRFRLFYSDDATGLEYDSARGSVRPTGRASQQGGTP